MGLNFGSKRFETMSHKKVRKRRRDDLEELLDGKLIKYIKVVLII